MGRLLNINCWQAREFEPHQRPRCLLYSNCLVLVGSWNGFERDLHKPIACLTIELK